MTIGHAVLLCCLQALGLGERHILQVPMSKPLLQSHRDDGGGVGLSSSTRAG